MINTIHLETVDSTNTWAKENYETFDLTQMTRITTSKQTQGRGRYKRSWISGTNQNIVVTYFFTLLKLNCQLSNLSQLLSLSIVKMLEQNHVAPELKWPNDILIQRKKIGGVLCEVVDLDDHYGIVIGAGVNINMPKEDLAIIDQKATSLLVETGQTYALKPLQESLDQLFYQDLSLYKTEGFTPFYDAYHELLAQKGETITLKGNREELKGVLHSLNPDGRLNLLLPSGEIKVISCGEIPSS